MTVADWVALVVALTSFLGAQAVAIYLFRHKERRAGARLREAERKAQLEQMKSIVDEDIERVGERISELLSDISKVRAEIRELANQSNQRYEHIKESRPTRGEMEKELKRIRELVLSQGESQQSAINTGFASMDRRFDEFRDYMRDIQQLRSGG